MTDELKPGDRVAWNTSQGETTGVVKKKLTEETEIDGWTAKASEEEPQYLVESDKTGERAAHRPAALRKAS